jgi:hypothetical protein
VKFGFGLHQIQQAIEPHLSLQQTLYSWNEIAEALAEKSRKRLLQLEKWRSFESSVPRPRKHASCQKPTSRTNSIK